MNKIFSILFVCLTIVTLTFSTSAAVTSDFDFSIVDVNNIGEINDTRFWERANYMQAYVYPASSYYVGSSDGNLTPHNAYIPLQMPRYLTSPYSFDEDMGDWPYINRLMSGIWYSSPNGDTEVSLQGAIITEYLSRNGQFGGEFRYSFSNVFNGPDTSSLNVLLVGDTYSYKESHTFGGTPNNVDVVGLRITNPSQSTKPMVIYVRGSMKWAGRVTNDTIPHGAVTIDTHLFLNPGDSIVFDATLIEGETGGVDPITTCFSGAVMIRHSTNFDERAIITETFNDYFSYGLNYSDTNYGGIGYANDGVNGGFSIVSAFNSQYWGTAMENPNYGTLTITNNGVYSTKYYDTVEVNVPQELEWGGLYDWLVGSFNAFTSFEIAPGWSIGIILSVVVGLAVIMWILKIFLGG